MRKLALALASTVAFCAAATAAPVTMYKQPGFTGEALAVQGTVRDLKPHGFQNQASSIVIADGYWQFCSEPNFKGSCAMLMPGRYATLDTQLDRHIESVREMERAGPGKWVPRDPDRIGLAEPVPLALPLVDRPALELFAGPSFGGTSVATDRDIADLLRTPIGRDVASFVVRAGRWEVCTERGYAGRCRVYDPGSYAELGRMERRIESVRRVG